MRPFLHLSVQDLERMADEHGDNREIVEGIAREVALRQTDRARTLHRRLVQRLSTGVGRSSDPRTDLARRIREERQDFLSFREADRDWICFLLDMRSLPPRNADHWSKAYPIHLVLAANDLVRRTTGEAAGETTERANENDCRVFQPMIEMAVMSLSHDRCTEFAPFDFLHHRLFGGRLRPFAASVFAAAAFHPAQTSRIDIEGICEAESRSEPVFWPEITDITRTE